MAVNMSFLNTANHFGEVVAGINGESNGMFASLIILSVFFVLFLSMKSRGSDTMTVFFVSSFVSTLTGLLLFIVGWISWGIFLYPLVMLIVSMFIHVFNR